MHILIFSTIIVWNVSQSEKNSARYDHNFTSNFMYSPLL